MIGKQFVGPVKIFYNRQRTISFFDRIWRLSLDIFEHYFKVSVWNDCLLFRYIVAWKCITMPEIIMNY